MGSGTGAAGLTGPRFTWLPLLLLPTPELPSSETGGEAASSPAFIRSPCQGSCCSWLCHAELRAAAVPLMISISSQVPW